MPLYFEPFFDLDRVNEAFRTHANAFNSLIDGASGAAGLSPRVDFRETPTGTVTATFELPGFPKESIHIDAFPGRLRISADPGSDNQLHRRYGQFSRTLHLPLGVTEDQVKASMENGVLSVTYPKSTPHMPPKKIEIA
ncbi:SHSP domain-containing protein [Mycena indigotica]|uniref:SHSP domain-containing protein n=1 Tax=Mycena indigotica TaxID=2126181 RepID=A0A8H6SGQ9_9AGAR|nr:SHSP domain-containing protein [Mycena indigotica]KAF7299074.1 SHSP domain-containing protein [Mycena indigotica]